MSKIPKTLRTSYVHGPLGGFHLPLSKSAPRRGEGGIPKSRLSTVLETSNNSKGASLNLQGEGVKNLKCLWTYLTEALLVTSLKVAINVSDNPLFKS